MRCLGFNQNKKVNSTVTQTNLHTLLTTGVSFIPAVSIQVQRAIKLINLDLYLENSLKVTRNI